MRGIVTRQDRALPMSTALDLMKGADYGILATVNAEGKPCVAAVNHVILDKETFIFHCSPKSEKVNNIRLNPNVSFHVVKHAEVFADHFTTVYESAVAHGVAEMVEDREQKQKYLNDLMVRFAGDSAPTEVQREYIEDKLDSVAVVEVKIEHLTAKARPPLR